MLVLALKIGTMIQLKIRLNATTPNVFAHLRYKV